MDQAIRRARNLRHGMTEPEIILWSRLRRLRNEGFHVRRQAPFRGYYLDFVCFDRRVVIEVDGGQHGDDDQITHDMLRTEVLRREGFTVLRFWNSAVRENLDGVMDTIRAALRDNPTPLAWRQVALPMKGEGKRVGRSPSPRRRR